MARIERILRWTAVILLVIFGFWLTAFSGVNFGGAISRLLGKKKKPPKIVDSSGETNGEVHEIVQNKNPFRDKGQVQLDNGETIDLPDKVQDNDVESVIVVEPEVVDVQIKHDRITDVFDRTRRSNRGRAARNSGKG